MPATQAPQAATLLAGTPADFTAGQTALFDEIADTIIPPAAVPGTKSGRAWANAIT